MAASDFRRHRQPRSSQQTGRFKVTASQHHDDDLHEVSTNEPTLLPQSDLAERALIGAALSDERVLESCANVRPRYFFRHSHQLVWEAMQELHAAHRPVDYISVSELLTERNKLEDVGGVETLIQFGNELPPVGHAPAWAETICKRYYARFMLDCNAKLAQVAYRGDFEEMKSAWALQYTEMQEVLAALGITTDGVLEGPRHQLKTLTEMRNKPRAEWIIPGILHERKRSLIFGDSNCGKSFLAVDLGLSISTGRAWHGRPIQKPGAVVYVCAEGADDIINRVDVWLRHHGLDDAPNFWIVDDSPNLLELGDVSGVITQINNTLDEPPAVVVFDTLAASMPGGDEKDSLDMGIVIGAIHRVQQECHCGVLVVHHSGKDESKGPRGSSALRADVDMALRMSMDEPTGVIAVNGDKWRSGDKKKLSFGFRLESRALDNYADLTSCILEETGKPFASEQQHQTAAQASHTSHAPTNGRQTAPDRLFALMQEIAKPLRDGEWERLFVERNLGANKTYQAAMTDLRRRHLIENYNGAWIAVGVI